MSRGYRAMMRWTFHASARRLESIATGLKRADWGRYRLGRHVVDALLLPSDFLRVRGSYSAVFGSPPNLFRPRTFNEKLQRGKFINRKPHHSLFADKIAVRDYVRDRVGEQVLSKVFWTGVDLREARKQPLPNRFVIKANHSSGSILIVRDAALFDWDAAEPVCRRWLEIDYSARFAEWEYRWILPKLFIEEYLEELGGREPRDYKFLCFHGQVELVQVDINRFSNHTRAFLDRDFNRLAGTFKVPEHDGALTRPACYEQMREIAERLAGAESFIRVDLYDIGRPVFGELTLHPRAGHAKFEPSEWDEKLGALWT